MGGLIFIDLRDREGIMQLVINPETVSAEVMATAESIRSEYVVEVTGLVAVSYTHLDVYKRQSSTQSRTDPGSDFLETIRR